MAVEDEAGPASPVGRAWRGLRRLVGRVLVRMLRWLHGRGALRSLHLLGKRYAPGVHGYFHRKLAHRVLYGAGDGFGWAALHDRASPRVARARPHEAVVPVVERLVAYALEAQRHAGV